MKFSQACWSAIIEQEAKGLEAFLYIMC